MATNHENLRRHCAFTAAFSALAGCVSAPTSKPQIVATALPDIHLDTPSELSSWPWPNAKADAPHRGVTHWHATARDKTSVDLLEFDFQKNPALRFELYSQDEDDAKPFDNSVQFWPMGVGQATRHLNARLQKSGGGKIIAAWNGPFFGYYRSAPIPKETAFHLAPITLRGKVHFNTRNHRWSMGVKMVNGKPVFKTFHLPGTRAFWSANSIFSSGTLQCLLKDGKALKIEPFPRGPRDFKKQPVPSTPQEAGHVPYFDHAKFSRASLGWSHDSSALVFAVGARAKWQLRRSEHQ